MTVKPKTIKECVTEAKQAFDLAYDSIKADNRYNQAFHYDWPSAIADIAMRRYTSNDIELAKAGISREPTSSGSGKPQSSGKLHCSACDTIISQKVFQFSMDRYDKPLCMNCQKQE